MKPACTCYIGGFDHSADCAVAKWERSRPVAPITVVSAVLWLAGHVVLGKRVGQYANGVWCCPGGKADAPGRLMDHVIREVKEETGLILGSDCLREVPVWREYIDENGQVFTCVYYEASIIGCSDPVALEPDKISEWRLFSPFDLPERMFDGEKAVIMRSLEYA